MKASPPHGRSMNWDHLMCGAYKIAEERSATFQARWKVEVNGKFMVGDYLVADGTASFKVSRRRRVDVALKGVCLKWAWLTMIPR